MMDLKHYVEQRVGVVGRAIDMADASERQNLTASGKRTFHEMGQQLRLIKLEMLYVLFYAENGVEHPDLHPEWDASPATLARRIRDVPGQN